MDQRSRRGTVSQRNLETDDAAGDEIRIHTWTLKDGPGVDRLRQCTSPPCAHLRNGVYRDATVHGDSTMYVDGTTVATTRRVAEAATRLDRTAKALAR